jgi:hypothetical protein
MYTFRGIPVITGTQALGSAIVNGDTICGQLTFLVPYEAIVDITGWPFDRPANPPLCNQPNVTVKVCPLPTLCSDEFTYTGDDVSVNLSLPVDEYPANVTVAIAHFVHDGVPQTVTITAWLFESGGYPCSFKSRPVPPAVVSEVAHIWPTIDQCSPPGQDVHVTFKTAEFGELHATFQWTNGDVNYDVDTGAFGPTPTPSPSPPATPPVTPSPVAPATPTPARLPQSGGAPAVPQLPFADLAAAVVAISAGMAILFTALQRRM